MALLWRLYNDLGVFSHASNQLLNDFAYEDEEGEGHEAEEGGLSGVLSSKKISSLERV